MKIGILTQPLINNYGGILQNYALQIFLKRECFEPCTINRHFSPTLKIQRIVSILKRGFLKYFLHKNVIIRIYPTKKEQTVINQKVDQFVRKNIIQTEKFHKNRFDLIQKKYKFDAYIVGSDQVWRPKYSPCITNYFLDFLDGNTKVKKIAYAASFGTDDWEFTIEQTKNCSALAKQFDAISVRENSAVSLCKKYLCVEAIPVLDPTMLLTKEDYLFLIEQESIPERRNNILFTYFLDDWAERKNMINEFASKLNLQEVSGMPLQLFELRDSYNLYNNVYPSIAEWLSGFRDARFVITDSFHGTVFSILFKKNFLVYVNEQRGLERLNSLLKLFGLMDRVIFSYKELPQKTLEKNIDWRMVYDVLEKEKKKSYSFLKQALS
jgi:hypothetical protein